jgi:hypothetical protein
MESFESSFSAFEIRTNVGLNLMCCTLSHLVIVCLASPFTRQTSISTLLNPFMEIGISRQKELVAIYLLMSHTSSSSQNKLQRASLLDLLTTYDKNKTGQKIKNEALANTSLSREQHVLEMRGAESI